MWFSLVALIVKILLDSEVQEFTEQLICKSSWLLKVLGLGRVLYIAEVFPVEIFPNCNLHLQCLMEEYIYVSHPGSSEEASCKSHSE